MSNDGVIRIVVGVDFTDVGDHALDEALRYAVPIEHDELHPVYVIARPDSMKLDELNRFLEDARTRLREHVVARCNALGKQFEQKFVFHVRIGEPGPSLHQVAVDVDADLIIVGTHARRGLPKLLLGSVAEELVRVARVPVMVARPKQLDDLPKTPAPDEARPGEDLHAHRGATLEHVAFGRRPSHISGLL
jgi:nucleotide-binding universal stress UspA family protein